MGECQQGGGNVVAGGPSSKVAQARPMHQTHLVTVVYSRNVAAMCAEDGAVNDDGERKSARPRSSIASHSPTRTCAHSHRINRTLALFTCNVEPDALDLARM